MTSDATKTGGITIYGIPLGVPFSEGLEAARATFTVAQDGDHYATASATIDGMKATVEIMAHDGRLEDVSLRLVSPQADESFAASKPLGRVTADIGAPDEVSIDLARWTTRGYEITLQQMFGMAKDATEGMLEYILRARPVETPAARKASEAKDSQLHDPPKEAPDVNAKKKAEEAAAKGAK